MEMTAPDMRLGYTQLNQLRDGLSQARASEGNGRDSQAELEQAAQQFESIFINMWLKSAREANQVFAENNITNSSEMVMQQEMLDHEMAVHMSRNGGIGLAPVIVRQLGGDPDQMSTPSPAAVSTPRVEHNIAPRGISAQVGAQQDGAQQEQAQRQSAFASPEDFVRALKPVVERALQNLPVSVTAVVGQAALETGWGSVAELIAA
ncbi:MAG: rod-binding protein, partial [Pseudomonadota bacterium]